MKLIHLSDLHLGKRIKEFSMLEDQQFILTQIIKVIDDEKPDAVIIAGDVYDKSVPSGEAVQLFDDFLVRLHKRNLQVFIISGNHDSAERLSFGGRLMESEGVHLSPVYNGQVEPAVLADEFGEVNVYMLPFIKPTNVRCLFPDEKIESYTDAVKLAITKMNVDSKKRNVIVTHQFVTGATTCDSEEVTTVGGTDNVDASVFDQFDYVALGHIHGPQSVGREEVRYCGTPLKYSMSEAKHQKSVTVVELNEKSKVNIKAVPLTPKHDMREIKGTYLELTDKKNYEGTNTDDYIHAVLTDEDDVFDAMSKLRTIYPNIMDIEYDNTRTRTRFDMSSAEGIEEKSEFELFSEFFQKQNGKEMSEEQVEYIKNLIEHLKEGN